jgi:hypothetical protein
MFSINDTAHIPICTEKNKKKISIFTSPSKCSKSNSDTTEKTDTSENDTALWKEFPESCTELRSLYHIKKIIGKGSYGNVYLVKSKIDAHEYAIKRINRRKGNPLSTID